MAAGYPRLPMRADLVELVAIAPPVADVIDPAAVRGSPVRAVEA